MKKGLKTSLIVLSCIVSAGAVTTGLVFWNRALVSDSYKKNENKINEFTNKLKENPVEGLTFSNLNSITQGVANNYVSSLSPSLFSASIQDGTFVKTINEDGTVNFKCTVILKSWEFPDSNKTIEVDNTVLISDFSDINYALYSCLSNNDISLIYKDISYRRFVAINDLNIKEYVQVSNQDQKYDYTFIDVTPDTDYNAISFKLKLVDKATGESITSNPLSLKVNVLPQVLLTNEIALKNLQPGGIWYGKTSLKAEDFIDYDIIQIDSLNNINLDSVELPSDGSLFDYEYRYKSIDWSGVKNITVKQTNESNDLYIEDNVLYYKESYSSSITVNALTIANRTVAMDKLVLYKNQITSDPNIAVDNSIGENFYNSEIFKNVKQIDLTNLSISSIGANAFANCDKLSDAVNISPNSSGLSIDDSSFTNTNMKALSIKTTQDNPLLIANIGANAFRENKLLTSLDINLLSYLLVIEDFAFADCSQLENINIVKNYNEKMITDETDAFSISSLVKAMEDLVDIVQNSVMDPSLPIWLQGLAALIVIPVIIFLFAPVILCFELSLASPVVIGNNAFAITDSSATPINRTVKIGGPYFNLVIDDNAFSGNYNKFELYCNELFYTVKETGETKNSLFILLDGLSGINCDIANLKIGIYQSNDTTGQLPTLNYDSFSDCSNFEEIKSGITAVPFVK